MPGSARVGAQTPGSEGGGAGALDPWVRGGRGWGPGFLGPRGEGLGVWTPEAKDQES